MRPPSRRPARNHRGGHLAAIGRRPERPAGSETEAPLLRQFPGRQGLAETRQEFARNSRGASRQARPSGAPHPPPRGRPGKNLSQFRQARAWWGERGVRRAARIFQTFSRTKTYGRAHGAAPVVYVRRCPRDCPSPPPWASQRNHRRGELTVSARRPRGVLGGFPQACWPSLTPAPRPRARASALPTHATGT